MEISQLKNKYPKARKFFSKLIPALSLLLILFLFLSFILNYFLGYSWAFFVLWGFFIVLYVWWLIRGFEYVILVLAGILRYKNFQKLNLQNIFSWKPLSRVEKQIFSEYNESDLKISQVYHWIIIPTFQDPYEMIEDTFESIKNSDFDNKKILITLAWEESDKDNFLKLKEKIKEKYGNTFGYLNFTLHKLQPGEVQGKGSNVKYSAKITYKDILKITSAENILVHVMDSESIVQDRYFLAMWLEFCLTKSDLRHKTIYQPMLFLLNRFFQAPYFSKVIALSVGAYILWASVKWVGTRAQAVQAQSLKSLLDTDFYSSETITEDWHQYYRSYCAFAWKFQVKPVYTYVLLEPVIWQTIWETVKLQYNQIRRWAHWCLDLPYLILCAYEKRKKLPKLRTLYEIFWLIEASVLWSSLQFILFFGSFFLILTWNAFWEILLLFNALALVVLLMVLLISYWFFPFKVLKFRKKLFELGKYGFFTFTLMWPFLLVLNWLPALHAQLMILFWKPMGKFKVTKKYR